MKYVHEAFPSGSNLIKRRELLEALGIDSHNRDLYAFISLIGSTQRQNVIEIMNLGNEFVKFGSDIERIELLEGEVSRSKLHDQLKQVSETAMMIAGTYVSTKIKSHLDLFMQELNNIYLLIDGQDLMDLGISEGPRVGEVLSKTLTHMIESGPLSKSEQMLLAKRFLKI